MSNARPASADAFAAWFNNGNGNFGTLVLNQENLETVVSSLQSKRDPKTGGLVPARYQLVVGPALRFKAQAILSATEIRVSDGFTSTALRPNPLAGQLTLTVNEKQPGTAWFVIPVPGSSRRPALIAAKLRGFEQPEFRYKADAGQLVGGGVLSGAAGSFDDDTIWYRGRHIIGSAHGDPLLTYASDNTGA